jgi:hypothetical protein
MHSPAGQEFSKKALYPTSLRKTLFELAFLKKDPAIILQLRSTFQQIMSKGLLDGFCSKFFFS